jgi:hypothetical protein
MRGIPVLSPPSVGKATSYTFVILGNTQMTHVGKPWLPWSSSPVERLNEDCINTSVSLNQSMWGY